MFIDRRGGLAYAFIIIVDGSNAPFSPFRIGADVSP
jgi:hypothetical protein